MTYLYVRANRHLKQNTQPLFKYLVQGYSAKVAKGGDIRIRRHNYYSITDPKDPQTAPEEHVVSNIRGLCRPGSSISFISAPGYPSTFT